MIILALILIAIYGIVAGSIFALAMSSMGAGRYTFLSACRIALSWPYYIVLDIKDKINEK